MAAKLLKQGFELDATHGTAIVLGEAGINPRLVNKVHEGRPHIQDRIKNGEYTYIINTTEGRQDRKSTNEPTTSARAVEKFSGVCGTIAFKWSKRRQKFLISIYSLSEDCTR